MSAQPSPAKKTIYVDVDDEITGIIDKVLTSKESIVALVLPKRATMLQSIVNMKLLKRAAVQNDKNVVLITSESTLMPLAGAASLHVAANLQSRPYLPAAPGPPRAAQLPADDADDAPIDPATPIGSLIDPKETASDPIEIDNRPKTPETAAATAAVGNAAKAAKKDKNKKVPNFNKFRTLLLAGVAAFILLIGGGYWALAAAPKATVTLRTESSENLAEAKFTADTEAQEINLEEAVLPAEQRELKKTESEKVPATGEKDNGTKASGSVKMRNCSDNAVTIPAGTGVSNGDLTFITQAGAQLDSTIVKKNGVTQCQSEEKSVNVIAQQNGDKYNLSPRTYVVAGFAGVITQGDQMSGGTSKIAKVVSAADVETAKKKISDKQNASVEEIKNELKSDGYIGLVDTFSTGTPNLSAAPAVGVESADVTVSGEVTYTMLGVKEVDLKKIIEEQSKDTVDTSKQAILNYGFDDATYEIGTKRRSTTDITIKTTLLAGPEVNQDQLKKEFAGKKRGDVESQLKSRPGITEARVDFKPFWVSKVPKNPSKITFIIEQADGKRITP